MNLVEKMRTVVQSIDKVDTALGGGFNTSALVDDVNSMMEDVVSYIGENWLLEEYEEDLLIWYIFSYTGKDTLPSGQNVTRYIQRLKRECDAK